MTLDILRARGRNEQARISHPHVHMGSHLIFSLRTQSVP